MNPLQPTYGGGDDAFVTKINPTGSALVHSTYLGGSGEDGGSGIAVDSAGNAYVTGVATSHNFPTESPVQRRYGGHWDAFVTKINPTGSALFSSTYLGAWDQGSSIAVDSSGNAYVTGGTSSTDFPVTPGAFQPVYGGGDDAFVAKIQMLAATTTTSRSLAASVLRRPVWFVMAYDPQTRRAIVKQQTEPTAE